MTVKNRNLNLVFVMGKATPVKEGEGGMKLGLVWDPNMMSLYAYQNVRMEMNK